MTFDEVLEAVVELLRREGRVSYRALRRRFELDDDYLEDLKSEIIDAKRLATDEDGTVLVWAGAAAPGSAEDGAGGAERRHLTVMFCDLANWTALSGRLDPEDLREVVRVYQDTSARVIDGQGGHIAQYLGDGLLVYFGYPHAHEDSAHRAVLAGLGIVDAIRSRNAQLERDKGVRLTVRVGIHTGLVVVGEVGSGTRREQLALGETPNLAARIQAQAAPDSVVISEATALLVYGFFELERLGAQLLRGRERPMLLHRVRGESGARSRFEVAVSRGLTSLVAREEEAELLRRRWETAKGGEGQVVLLSGEAGIGKSRLAQELKERVDAEGNTRIEFRCSPYHKNSALHPVIEYLQRLLDFGPDTSDAQKRRRLGRALSGFSESIRGTEPLFAALLSLPEPGTGALGSAQRQKQDTQEAVVAWLLEAAERQPLLVVWEDVHWADASTLELFQTLIDRTPEGRMLNLLTFRPDLAPPWGMAAHMTQLTLNRLGRREVGALITSVAGGKALPPEVVEQVSARTDGVPLFVEELTKMVLESPLIQERGDRYELEGPLPRLAIPATLQDSLMARLDRLDRSREVAQLAATLGREFPEDLIQAVSRMPRDELARGLQRLVDAELLYRRGAGPRPRYFFKHALIQDAAYLSLLRTRRQAYHETIAGVLEAQFPETARNDPEVIAHHYTEAGRLDRAAPYWQRAGRRAVERSAHIEAVAHLRRGLEVLERLPDSPERAAQELGLQTTLGSALIATRGYAAPDVEQAYRRARELCQQAGGTPRMVQVLLGLHAYYVLRAEFQTSRELAERCLELAADPANAGRRASVYYALGLTLFYLGDAQSARAYFEQGYAAYERDAQRSSRGLQDPGIGCLAMCGCALWLLGSVDRGREQVRRAVALARELGDPFNLAMALSLSGWLYQFRGEVEPARALAEEALALCADEGSFPFWEAMATSLRGWALTQSGQRSDGIAQMLRGLETWRAIGTELGQQYWLGRLAEVRAADGRTEEAIALLDEAMAAVEKTGERYWQAQLYLVRGDILERQPDAGSVGAESAFRHALALARGQGALPLALRAATRLARLVAETPGADAARATLSSVAGEFTEGLDTADLREARALLGES